MPKSKVQIHHMLRTLSFTNAEGAHGAKPVAQLDDDVQIYLDQGYDLASTHYTGETPDGLRILYILVKRTE